MFELWLSRWPCLSRSVRSLSILCMGIPALRNSFTTCKRYALSSTGNVLSLLYCVFLYEVLLGSFDLAFLSLLTSLCLRHVLWKPSGFLRMLFLALNISLHPLQNSFPPRRQKFSPGNSSIRSRVLMFFGSELPLSLYFPVLLLGTRSLEIKALGTALEVLEVVEFYSRTTPSLIWGLRGRAAEP